MTAFSRAHLGYFCPAVADLPVSFDKVAFLLMSPALLVDVGPQLVVPPLPELLADAAFKLWQQFTPAAHTMLLDQPT